MDADLTLAALDATYVSRTPGPGTCIHHTDRGIQYANSRYRRALEDYGLIGSMSAARNPYDNAQAESLMKTLKVEEVYLDRYVSFRDVVTRLPRFIEDVYKPKRMHPALDYFSPNQFEDAISRQAA